ncbi:MAG: replication-relaxation family protein [Chthonomonas sp.]|nr:replication-relaxation family protein [Chthonomonas sp.]
MQLTERDRKLVFEIAMSHVLSRDQILSLGLFGSVTRVNTRLRTLRELGLVRRLETPYFNGSLFVPGVNAPQVLDANAANLIRTRQPSPRFLRHALCVTNIRLALAARGAYEWRFEPMLWRSFEHQGRTLEVRPDGMAISPKGALLVECDLGHTSPLKFEQKLAVYHEFLGGGHANQLWGINDFNLLTITTGNLRASTLRRCPPKVCAYGYLVQTFEQIGAGMVGGWS